MPSSPTNHDFRNFVFAGGGSRCFWQAGFWTAAAPKLNFQPEVIGAVSAGSAIACMLQIDRVEETLNEFLEATAKNAKNVYPENALRGKPLFPQARIYRATLQNALTQQALSRLHQGPEIRILTSVVPRPLGPTSGACVGLAAYLLDKHITGAMHPKLGRALGFRPTVRSVRSCKSPRDLIDLIMASSSTPPFTPAASAHGRPALDGGLVDNVPVEAVDDAPGDTLVLLTRQYAPSSIPVIPGRTYVQPSRPVGVGKWDYTSPEKIQAAFDLGLQDGETFARQHIWSDSPRREPAARVSRPVVTTMPDATTTT